MSCLQDVLISTRKIDPDPRLQMFMFLLPLFTSKLNSSLLALTTFILLSLHLVSYSLIVEKCYRFSLFLFLLVNQLICSFTCFYTLYRFLERHIKCIPINHYFKVLQKTMNYYLVLVNFPKILVIFDLKQQFLNFEKMENS